MSSKDKNLSDHRSISLQHADQLKIGIVYSTYHSEITEALKDGAIHTLSEAGITDIRTVQTPGAFELPLAAEWLFGSDAFDAIICLGCVIKGDTDHDVYINHSVARAMMDLNLKHLKPFVFGLLTPNNLSQARDRSGGKHGNKGVECAAAAIQMIRLSQSLQS